MTTPKKTQRCAHPRRHRYWATVWHHVQPQSWGGATTPENLAELCDNHHAAAHVLIDLGVAANALPSTTAGASAFTPYLRKLADQAWAHRPTTPTRTRITDH